MAGQAGGVPVSADGGLEGVGCTEETAGAEAGAGARAVGAVAGYGGLEGLAGAAVVVVVCWDTERGWSAAGEEEVEEKKSELRDHYWDDSNFGENVWNKNWSVVRYGITKIG